MTTTKRFTDIITGDIFDMQPATNVVHAGSTCPQDCDGGPDTDDAYQTSELTVDEWYWIEDEWGNWYVAKGIDPRTQAARIEQDGGRWPTEGDFVRGGGNLYLIVSVDNDIQTELPGKPNWCRGLVRLADWSECAEDDEASGRVVVA